MTEIYSSLVDKYMYLPAPPHKVNSVFLLLDWLSYKG